MTDHGRGSVPFRVGNGFDVHGFSADPGRRLVLGGLVLSEEGGLSGHSDADVVVHALADSLLGAAGLGDLGTHFPDSDPAFSGAVSTSLLDAVVSMLAGAGFRPVNSDCTVICDRPALGHRTKEMSELLGSRTGAPVHVKAKRAEGLGAIGRGEGIACLAVSMVELVAAPGPARAGART